MGRVVPKLFCLEEDTDFLEKCGVFVKVGFLGKLTSWRS